MIDRLEQPTRHRWTSWFGYHPHNRQRRKSVDDPQLLAIPSLPEAVGIGTVSGLLLWQLFHPLGFFLSMNPLGSTISVSIAGGFMTILLTLTVWRSAAVHRHRLTPRHVWLHFPLLAVLAFHCGGSFLPAMYQSSALGRFSAPLTNLLLSAIFLIAAMVTLSLWVKDVSWAAPTDALYRSRRVKRSVTVAGVFVTAAWIWTWFSSTTSDLWTPKPGMPPENGAEIGWYTLLTQWTGTQWGVPISLSGHPSLLLGVLLLWLTPVALSIRSARSENTDRRWRPNYRFAVMAGSMGAIVILGIDIVFVFLARAVLPEEVRSFPENDRLSSANYVTTQFHLWVALAVLAQVVVAAVVAAVVRRYRVILVALATQTTTIIAAIGLSVGVSSVAKCVDLYGVKPKDVAPIDPRCVSEPGTLWSIVGTYVHWITAHGAIPVMLVSFLAAGAAQVIRRVRGTPETVADSPAPGRLVLAVLAFLAVVSIGIAGSSLPALWVNVRGFG